MFSYVRDFYFCRLTTAVVHKLFVFGVVVWLMIALQNAVNVYSELKKQHLRAVFWSLDAVQIKLIETREWRENSSFLYTNFLPLKTRQFLHGRTSHYRTVDRCVCEFNAVVHTNFESDSDFFIILQFRIHDEKSLLSDTMGFFFFGWFSTTHCAAYYSATHNERQTMTIEKKKSLCCMVSLVAIFLELCCKIDNSIMKFIIGVCSFARWHIHIWLTV